MAHLSAEELNDRLTKAKEQVAIGDRYAHYKHPDKPYKIVSLAFLEANDEVAVIYQQEHEYELTFVRPLVSFLEEVEVDGKNVRRFTKL